MAIYGSLWTLNQGVCRCLDVTYYTLYAIAVMAIITQGLPLPMANGIAFMQVVDL